LRVLLVLLQVQIWEFLSKSVSIEATQHTLRQHNSAPARLPFTLLQLPQLIQHTSLPLFFTLNNDHGVLT
jgi:hypothetical protein